MFGHRLRHWSNIKTTPAKLHVFVGHGRRPPLPLCPSADGRLLPTNSCRYGNLCEWMMKQKREPTQQPRDRPERQHNSPERGPCDSSGVTNNKSNLEHNAQQHHSQVFNGRNTCRRATHLIAEATLALKQIEADSLALRQEEAYSLTS